MLKYAPASNGNKKWKFYCNFCDYGCKRSFLMTQHEKTQKHQMLKNAQKCSSQNYEEENKSSLHVCKCGKTYKHIQSFKRHLKDCSYKEENIVAIQKKQEQHNDLKMMLTNIHEQYKNMVIENKEMREIVADMVPRLGSNNTTINNTVNIHVFLNEKCKDALNLTDFIDTLDLESADLELSKESGAAAGIANIFVKGLNALSLDKRPIHCSDLKHEVLFVKDDGVWEQENEDKQKIKDAISSVSKKQIASIKEWENAHPGWQTTEKGTTEYCEMVRQITASTSSSDENKIIKTIAKNVIIDK
ncbi:MAG: hypothetical protein CBC22_04895 [Alphaproteobacteria bacterium TMED62]|nr:MAG: hypothetical protein CBC22_04895 [Alphaproteobacteria bacterium TMED62]